MGYGLIVKGRSGESAPAKGHLCFLHYHDYVGGGLSLVAKSDVLRSQKPFAAKEHHILPRRGCDGGLLHAGTHQDERFKDLQGLIQNVRTGL